MTVEDLKALYDSGRDVRVLRPRGDGYKYAVFVNGRPTVEGPLSSADAAELILSGLPVSLR